MADDVHGAEGGVFDTTISPQPTDHGAARSSNTHQRRMSEMFSQRRTKTRDSTISVFSNLSSDTSGSEGSDVGAVTATVSGIGDTRSRQIKKLREELSTMTGPRTSLVSNFMSSIQTLLRFARGTPGERWIRSSFAGCLFGGVIIVNAIFIGFETDFNRPDVDGQSEELWFGVETAFLIIFIIELALRWQADGCRMLLDLWNVFDAILVILGIFDTWIMKMVLRGDDGRGFATLTIFRLLRLVRIARVLRILRLLRFIRELLLLVQGILGALKALTWAFLLISIVLYIAAVCATEIIRDEFGLHDENAEDVDPDIKMWFGSVGYSLLTLAQLMTMEGWPEVIRKTVLHYDKVWLMCFFLPFLCCTNFALLNVVTAVMVEKVFEYAQDEKLQDAKNFLKERKLAIQKISRLFGNLDADGDGALTVDEMKRAFDANPVTLRQFQDLGIAKHDIDTLFSCLDIDANGELSVAEFVEGCLRMHGSATSKDLLRIQYDVHRTRKALDIKKLTKHMSFSSWCLQQHAARKRVREKKTRQSVFHHNEGQASSRSKARMSRCGAAPSPFSSRRTGRSSMLAPDDAMGGKRLVQRNQSVEDKNEETTASQPSESAAGGTTSSAVVGIEHVSSCVGASNLATVSKHRNSHDAADVGAASISASAEAKSPASATLLGGFTDIDVLSLPKEAQELLVEVLQEQKKTRQVVETLGNEVRTLRRHAMDAVMLQPPPSEELAKGGGELQLLRAKDETEVQLLSEQQNVPGSEELANTPERAQSLTKDSGAKQISLAGKPSPRRSSWSGRSGGQSSEARNLIPVTSSPEPSTSSNSPRRRKSIDQATAAVKSSVSNVSSFVRRFSIGNSRQPESVAMPSSDRRRLSTGSSMSEPSKPSGSTRRSSKGGLPGQMMTSSSSYESTASVQDITNKVRTMRASLFAVVNQGRADRSASFLLPSGSTSAPLPTGLHPSLASLPSRSVATGSPSARLAAYLTNDIAALEESNDDASDGSNVDSDDNTDGQSSLWESGAEEQNGTEFAGPFSESSTSSSTSESSSSDDSNDGSDLGFDEDEEEELQVDEDHAVLAEPLEDMLE